MSIIDAFFNKFFLLLIIIGGIRYGWRFLLWKFDSQAYERQLARDQFVKKHGLTLGAKLLKMWLK